MFLVRVLGAHNAAISLPRMATPERHPNPANLPGMDYAAAATSLPWCGPIIDAHIHIGGTHAAQILLRVAKTFGVVAFISQTRLSEADAIKSVLGDAVRFVAGPNWGQQDKARAFRQGFLEDIAVWHERHKARMIKLWAAPRLWDILGTDARDVVPLDSEWRIRAVELAQSLGMALLVHVADPDTWFQTKYADAARYGAKRDQYLPFERMVGRYPGPWIAAHMAGSPEDLDFLDGLLSRHDNLHLDTSATKWMVRELSKHEPARRVEFFTRWKGRIFFGSDIVTTDEHLRPRDPTSTHPMSDLADGPEAAFDLYASRYWTLRTLFETAYDGPSPIADPDLMLVDAERYDAFSSPPMRGAPLSNDVLESLYRGAATNVLMR